MAKAAFGKMTGREAALTILGAVLIGASGWGATSYIAAQKEIRLAEIASEERKKTIEDLTSAMESQAEQYKQILESMHSAGEVPSKAADAFGVF